PALVAIEHLGTSRIESKARGIDNRLRERGDVPKTHVEALAGNRMDHVRSVADQRDAIGDESARDGKPERVGLAGPHDCNLAETQPETLFEFIVERGIVERQDALGLGGGFRPYDRRAAIAQRQDREWSGGKKVLLRATMMIARMLHCGDNRRLAVRPTEALDPRS